jgi:hypothetical protein
MLATLAGVRTSVGTCIRYMNQRMYAMYAYEQHLSSTFVNTTRSMKIDGMRSPSVKQY